jgi:ferredoxin-NADP reductase/DMSO/TMAO reductase YedYZ heme-binding membrane subunit
MVRRGLHGWDAAVLLAANAVAVTGLWWREGGVREVHDAAGLLTSLGRLTGLLGALLSLAMLLLLARVPVLAGQPLDRVNAWHRRTGTACVALLVAHTGLITAGYALQDNSALGREIGHLLDDYSGVLLGTVGLALLVAVAATSAGAARRRLSARAWRAIHLTAYAGIALGFSHQLATGHEFAGQPVARAYWWALYAATAAAVIGTRVVRPLIVSLGRHRLRVVAVRDEAPGVVSIEIGGRRLDRLPAQSGQFLYWRFLAPGLWQRARAYSLSRAPDGRTLRITVKAPAAPPPGTRVIAEGPAGGLTQAARTKPSVAMIAGGVGIAPIRALLEDMPARDIAIVYRATDPGTVLFRGELDALAQRRGATLHYVLGDRAADGALSPERLRELIPDLPERDVFVCGPASMTEAACAGLRAAGVPRRQIVAEGFGR